MPYPTNCADSHAVDCSNNKCRIRNRLYGAESFLVACNDTSEAGGWTVIQRRINGSVDFHRDWPDYRRGFGDLDGDFWMGLDKLHALTTLLAPVELLIELQDFDNVRRYARYDAFGIGDEASKYALTTLGTNSGTAGDSLSYNKGHTFATKDQDNSNKCALNEHGAWWYENCSYSNLNGQYLETPKTNKAIGIYWHGFRGHYYSMQFAQMMIRPKYI